MPVAAEPQVVALLLFLIENRDRLVTRDEIVDAVWSGRIVSDAAISSRIKSARQAVGDDGNEQRIIRTIHGRGFRFIAEVEDNIRTPASTMEPRQDSEETAQSRPSIAVMPAATPSSQRRCHTRSSPNFAGCAGCSSLPAIHRSDLPAVVPTRARSRPC
jgi:DNA-binding winged helix-turn-helix (wHTH) protein